MTDAVTETEIDYKSRQEARAARMRQCRLKAKIQGLRLMHRMCRFVQAECHDDAKAARVSMENWACRLADTLGELDELSGGKEPCEWGDPIDAQR